MNSYGHPQAPHLYSGPSPMYPISTQDSAGYNRPGKSPKACFTLSRAVSSLTSCFTFSCLGLRSLHFLARVSLQDPKGQSVGHLLVRYMSWETKQDRFSPKLSGMPWSVRLLWLKCPPELKGCRINPQSRYMYLSCGFGSWSGCLRSPVWAYMISGLSVYEGNQSVLFSCIDVLLSPFLFL